MNSKVIESIELRYQEGSSDKVYKASVEQAEAGYVVNFAYGRRGSTMNTGTKTQEPVTLEEAQKVYSKLVKSKTAKGYRALTGSGSTAAIGVTDNTGEDTGLRPQLLNPIDMTEAAVYMNDSNWCVQEKFDGRRLLIRKAGGTVTAANRRGLAVACPNAVIAALEPAATEFVLDGELVGEKLHCFDMLETHNSDMRRLPYSQRLPMLRAYFGTLKCGAFEVVHTEYGRTKRRFVEQLRAEGKEGAVFKQLNSVWSAGRPSTGGSALKLKFWESCSCVVSGINRQRSVELALGGKSVGNVTIPPNHAIPQTGQVVEVRYLYVNAHGGSLYQPVYLGVRGDVLPDECTLELQQLKYKAAA